jgi:hypothetical protein
MSKHARRLNLTANALFLVGGCTYALMDVMNTVIYRLALIVILLMFRALWARAVLSRTIQQSITQNSLDASEYTLDTILVEMSDAHPSMR